jgi:hypothetical protein
VPSECERRVCRVRARDGGGCGRALRERYGADYELLLRGARVHTAAGGDNALPPLASAQVASVLAMFTTELLPALIWRIGLDAEVAATHTRSRSCYRCWRGRYRSASTCALPRVSE